MSSAADDDRSELAALSSALRGLVELHGMTGSFGLPRQGPLEGVAAAPAPPELEVQPQGSPAAPAEPRPVPPPTTPPAAEAEPASSALPAKAEAEPASSALSAHPPRTLEVLQEEVKTCERCGLCGGRTQTVFSRGTGRSGLVFIGEGPGEEEDRTGLPFVGPAGQLLDRMIEAMKLERDDVYICNIVKCRPPKNRKPDAAEMAACSPWLEEQLQLIQPKVIVALGATAVQGLLGTTSGITRLRGRWKAYRGLIPVMPTFHPAYLLRQPRAKREVWQDLQEVLRHLESESSSGEPSSEG